MHQAHWVFLLIIVLYKSTYLPSKHWRELRAVTPTRAKSPTGLMVSRFTNWFLRQGVRGCGCLWCLDRLPEASNRCFIAWAMPYDLVGSRKHISQLRCQLASAYRRCCCLRLLDHITLCLFTLNFILMYSLKSRIARCHVSSLFLFTVYHARFTWSVVIIIYTY